MPIRTEVLFIAGRSGVGKSSVGMEISRMISWLLMTPRSAVSLVSAGSSCSPAIGLLAFFSDRSI
jgi:hypothetical protein